MQIPISNTDLFATVSVENFERVNAHKWCLNADGYAIMNMYVDGKRTTMRMHRFILNLANNDGQIVDHIDHCILNNHNDNLRICSIHQNNQNRRKIKKLCSSHYKGVSFHKAKNRWRAYIRDDGKLIHIGLFADEIAAAAAYNAKAIELFGAYACINNIG